MARKLIFLFLVHVWLEGSLAQHSSYSLQAAVDALHRREAQLALKDNYNISPHYGMSPAAQEQDYWDDDFEGGPPAYVTPAQSNNRHKLNRILASYLAREEDNARNGGGIGVPAGYELDDDNYLPEEKKRSFFRERDGKDEASGSPFRERDNQPYDNSELTDQFLKEIEEARQIDREERYKDALRRIWDKYQQQDNDIDNDPFEEQKRMASQPNYYVGPLMQKKRTYPVLPWLPMSRRKRFPVAKRSPKMPFDDTTKVSAEKVPDELRELFGKPSDDKKKRSTDDQSTDDQSTDVPVEKKNEKNDTATTEPEAEHPPHGGHHHKERKHRKRNDHSHESQEEEDEDSEEHEPEHEEHEEHEEEEEDEEHEHDDFEDEDEAQKKKKREAEDNRKQKRSNLEVVKEDQIIPGDMATAHRRKKSIQWNKYFGIDRRKKSTYDSADAKKRVPADEEDEEEEKRKKKNIDPEKLNNMGKKLQSIEDLIIDETVKYTGAHEGIADPDEIARLKDHVVSRLATAYSLEKMRRALEKLRQSVDNENHLLRNVVESDSKVDDDSDIENQKRLSVKKEKVEFQGLHHSINTPNNEKSKDVQGNSMAPDSDNDEEDKKKKKQKKRNGYQRYPDVPNDVSEFEEELGAGHYEPLNDAYLGNKNYIPGASQCPLIDTMAERCRGVDLLSGDINQELLPICGVHQICYLCGTSQVACDFQYLAEADSICGHNNECQSAARSVLMILRGSPGPQLGPKECLKNPCLNRAMREIGL